MRGAEFTRICRRARGELRPPAARVLSAAAAKTVYVATIVGFFDGLFGKGKSLERAKKAELRGDFGTAVEEYVNAAAPAEAARVLLLRAESEPDIRTRLTLFAQAARLAPEGSGTRTEARRRRATFALALLGDPPLSPLARHEAREAAAELEAIGDGAEAARAFRMAGDKEGEARALMLAGDIDSLENLLGAEADTRKASEEKKRVAHQIEELISVGLRRDAYALATKIVAESTTSEVAVETTLRALRGKRALGPRVKIALLGRPFRILFGDEIVIGRTEGTLLVPSQAISRRHLQIARARGKVTVRDLGSRNGTRYRGLPLAAPLEVEALGGELKLGGEVPLTITPSPLFPGAYELSIAGETWVVPLGPLNIGLGDWKMLLGVDDWLELHGTTPSPAIGGLSMHPATTLLVGDALTAGRDGETALSIVEVL